MSTPRPLATLTRDGAVAIVTLDRDERRNPLSNTSVSELRAIAARIDDDDEIGAVVLTGAGRAFCAGADLKERPEPAEDVEAEARHIQAMSRAWNAMVLAYRELHQPVIAAIHGPAVGGGFSLALAADVRIADVTARFRCPFHGLGLTGGDLGLSWLLPRVTTLAVAAELIYSMRWVEADEAFRLGIVSRVVPEGEHVAAATELAGLIAETPLGAAMTKSLLANSMATPSLRDHMANEARAQALANITTGRIG